MNQEQQQPAPQRKQTPQKKEQTIEWLTVTQAANRLQVNPRTIHKIIHDGELPASKIGRLLRIRRTDFEAFMENHRAT